MIERSLFSTGVFKQLDRSCMLASYGVAAQAFTPASVLDYLRAFSGDPAVDQKAAEAAYRALFVARMRQPGANGLKVVREAHETNADPVFVAMRATTIVSYLHSAHLLTTLLPALAPVVDTLGVVTVNVGTDLIGKVTSHAVCLGYDSKGWFALDVNTGTFVPDFAQPTELGDLGDALLLIRA